MVLQIISLIINDNHDFLICLSDGLIPEFIDS